MKFQIKNRFLAFGTFGKISVFVCRSFLLVSLTIASLNSQNLIAKEVKILTFNLYSLPEPLFSFGGRKLSHLEPLLNELKDYDLVFMQEAFSKKVRKLVAKAGFAHSHFGNYSTLRTPLGLLFGRDVGDGLVVLSRFPIIKSGIKKYKSQKVAGKKIPRCKKNDCWAGKGVQFVRLQITPDLEMDFYNTHLNSGGSSSDSVRGIQIEQVRDFINKNTQDGAFILAGDLNSPEKSNSYGKLAKEISSRDLWKEFISANPQLPDDEKVGNTSSPSENYWKIKEKNSKGDRRVDMLFGKSSKSVDFKLISMGVVMKKKFNGIHISDHFGVEALIDIYPSN